MMIFWLAAVILFGVIEVATLQLVSIWLAVGSLGALVGATLGAPVLAQFAIFILLSALLLVFTRPICRRFLETKKTGTNADRYIGSIVLVTEEIDNLKRTGSVVVSGLTWSARSADGSVIHAGEKVRIEGIEGVKFIVSKYEPFIGEQI